LGKYDRNPQILWPLEIKKLTGKIPLSVKEKLSPLISGVKS